MGKVKGLFEDAVIIHHSNYGEVVCCDGGNGPYDENRMNGGVIVGSSAMCQECCDRYGYDKPDYKYADEVDEIMNKNKTFEQNVLDYRKKMTGTSDAIVQILTDSK